MPKSAELHLYQLNFGDDLETIGHPNVPKYEEWGLSGGTGPGLELMRG